MPKGRPRTPREPLLVRSAEVIGWALGGLEREIMQTRERLALLTTEASKLRARLVSLQKRNPAAAERVRSIAGSLVPRRRRGPMSAAAKKRISVMMKKRWAERKRLQKKK